MGKRKASTGEQNHRAILTEELVLEMRAKAKELCMSSDVLRLAISGKSWRHI